MIINVKKIDENAILPKYAHDDDSGMDIYANEEAIIKPLERKAIGTGIKVEIPKGYEAQVRPKSGLALNYGITVLNTPGTIDSGYRGEIKVILINLSNKEYKVEKGSKIAQLIFSRVEKVELKEVSELSETKRNEKGFGSTGLK
ncbi:MAG: dUTP diphosphatase [Candidatus Diapherotrites archaeon]|nr:dUTP diphosphatase [Candidatus Diapherotrites archaeon]